MKKAKRHRLMRRPGFNKLKNWLRKLPFEKGVFLYDVEFLGGRVLRISIDKDAGPNHTAIANDLNLGDGVELEDGVEDLAGGAGIADCSKVAHGLNELDSLDDLVPGGNYNLEVSTPGIDRHLKKIMAF
jgi:ribosome maturation factor RimP